MQAVRGSRAVGGTAIIETEGLSKTYPGPVEAVRPLDLEIQPGEIYGLLGPNGAGKSTTIGMLTTRVEPTAGEARVGGVDIVRQPALAKQVIGVVPQTNTLDRQLTVAENLEFHGRYFGMPTKRARELTGQLLDMIRLSERADVPVMALSGGMAQRLMVARAIMHRPQILFLDEPTAGLDPQSRLAMWEILLDLHRDGQTILVTTHYMEEADQLCDRVAIMDHGRILALDTPERLKAGVGADRVVTVSGRGDLEALATHLKTAVEGVTGAQVTGDAVVLTATESEGLLPRIIHAADEIGAIVTDLHVAEPTLETVFITLTGKDLRE
jgi:ABC-2 type transport system ATP-binding protein